MKNRQKQKSILQRIMTVLRNEKSGLAKIALGAGLLAATLLLLEPSLYVTPEPLRVGDIAPRDIKARSGFLVEYEEATKARMEEIRHSVRAVYDFDPQVTTAILDKVDSAFVRMRHELLTRHSKPGQEPVSGAGAEPAPSKSDLATAGVEPVTFSGLLGISLSEEASAALEKAVYAPEVQYYAKQAIRLVMTRGVVSSPELLEEERGKGIIVRHLSTGKERAVTDVGTIYDLPTARNTLTNWVWTAVVGQEYYVRQAMVEVGEALLQPNLTFNRRETEERRQKAVAAVKPFYFQVKGGEMIVREGERIDEQTLLKLRGMNYFSRRTSFMLGVGSFVFLTLTLILVWAYIARFKPRLRQDLRLLLLLATIFIGNIAVVKLCTFMAGAIAAQQSLIPIQTLYYAVPVALGALLVSMLFEYDVVLLFTAASFCLLILLMKEGLPYALVGLAGGFVAATHSGRYQRRTSILRVGLLIGTVNVPVILSLNMIFDTLSPTEMAFDAGMGFLGGAVAAVVASGLFPLLEPLFHVTSDIKFLELSDLNSPLLRDLCVRAPGTYHHSVIVGNLAEEAAEAIGANALLARVSAYYHDIGKMSKPEYFIENQYGSTNKHDGLAPTMSSLVVVAHVKEGLELARSHNLGRDLEDIIEQHHGTSLLTYFYAKAKQMDLLAEQALDKEDFRYPGPKPQSREAAIVMLADAVEASSRTLAEPTPARIQALIRRIANNIFSDGQLDECDLTLRDLKRIVDSFTRILLGIFHCRIDYPTPEAAGLGRFPARGAYAGSDKRGAATGADRQAQAAEVSDEGAGHDGLQAARAEPPSRG